MKSLVAVGVLVGGLLMASHGYGVALVAAIMVAFGLTCLSRGRSAGHAHGGGNRWGVAVHEAGHVVAARKFGSASATVGDRRGHTSYDINGSAVDEAVVQLAGSIAAKRIAGDACLAGSSDIRDARRLLRGTGVSESEARARAQRIVSANSGAIRSAAKRGYKTGRI